MGKYQLDYKGMQQVERFHEKNSSKSAKQKTDAKDLKADFSEKNDKKGKVSLKIKEEGFLC
ncbi:hypothetical protein ABG810_09265 [Streptococcus iniae]|uniref:hypothetical protein n=1 Tax=Streptococcus iniae TaxID=1346 RepID=UPI002B2E5E3C|nr:hypothetical protein QYR55_09860 [Streptococcus iniae]WNZ89914.1 hypothetical protein QYR57_09580 [Streptococcus iniae]WNZ91545.1 hypothetical protein QYR59_09865 [Streptococcus iniae]WNZ94232.1 hypothetical protein QYR54_07775 [Streptococcus iniae]WNZ95987.1 hypothetical protein QYR60_09960 [Streptococcus iniae]